MNAAVSMNGCAPEFSAIRKQSRRLAEDRAGIGKPLVQTQVLGLQDIPINLVFSMRFSTPSNCRRATVVDFVAVKAPKNHLEPQLSIRWPQRIQSKAVIFYRFQQISINGRIGFGTRGSEVQILSPRPLFSITYIDLWPG